MNRAVKAVAATFLESASKVLQAMARPMRRAWFHARLAAKLKRPLDPSIVMLGCPEIRGTGQIALGRNLLLHRDLYLETRGEGGIEIGDGVVVSRGVHIVSLAKVKIGKGALIGEYASIRDAEQCFPACDSASHPAGGPRPIVIGENAWVGRGVTVMPGVTIGNGVVIGANAVVTHDIPDGLVVAGAPAKPLANREEKDATIIL